MELKELKPRIALNKAYLKVKPNRSDIERFKLNLIELLDRTNDTESEEFHKNLISDFLKDTYYKQSNFINTKGRNDLVIHNGSDAKSSVGVIIEAKKPTNKAEMLTKSKINVKAFQELVLYFLRERITHKNLEIKYLIATNINEWFIFDANFFEKFFAQNKTFVKQFTDFENGTLTGKTTDFFYKEIAEPFISTIKQEIEFTHFDIRDYDKPLRNNDKTDDNKLIALFKLLSQEHILKLPFANDSNSLDKRFYGELLHIIGLVETKDGGKKVIQRNPNGEQNTGSLLENAIIQLDSLDKINQLNNPSHFGEKQEERLFNVGLELVITWVNRILFLKLLEAQLIAYNKGDKSYSFLNIEKLHDYDDLNSLFFQVLARKHEERNQDVKQAFEKVPYLNSSLFEPTGIEHATIFISNLRDDKTIPVFKSTVLKDDNGKSKTGEINALTYFFEFLNAYDFSSTGSEEIQEENKTLINAAVLGLIFEKINGYKDGSFFTPGFITMYMCRETIRRAVVQKFNETKNWNIESFEALYDKIEDRTEANKIVDSIKICDPAVGSGHFLVSALNEVLAIKNDLKILQDRTGKRLKEYQLEVVNDELIVTDEEGELYDYNPKNKESQRVQETLFHEKQTIIENCLFGVDINPNSVKICRLRLWIELLKSAYYKNETELETLPNIDINIKCGNSLISRFDLDSDLGEALKKSKWNIQSYRLAVDTYRNAKTKEVKREMERLISDIKSDFRSEISINDPKLKKLRDLSGKLYNLTMQTQLFEESKSEKANREKTVKVLGEEIKKIETEVEEIKNNKIYENAFEWRFEFPEVLDDKGNFVGFDVVIGNPPYINFRDIKNVNEKNYYLTNYSVSEYQSDLFILFIELAFSINKKFGNFAFIIPNSIINNLNNSKIRKHILDNSYINSIVNTPIGIFPDATVDTVVILTTLNRGSNENIETFEVYKQNIVNSYAVRQTDFLNNDNFYFDFLTSNENREILSKIEKNTITLNEISDSSSGLKEYETSKGKPKQTELDRVNKVFNSDQKIDETYLKHIQGNEVNNYILNWKGGYLKYGMWIAAPREPKYFDGERIIIREIPGKNRLIASYTSEKYTIKNTAHVFLINKDYDAKFITGLLNSKLMGYYFVNKFSERDNVFPKAKIGQCRLLPIIKIKKENQMEISNIVTKIIDLKENNIATDISRFEKEIDQLVYKLYELTEEEIKVVEESVK
jgi:adenine-specific DNA-methyltransferase